MLQKCGVQMCTDFIAGCGAAENGKIVASHVFS